MPSQQTLLDIIAIQTDIVRQGADLGQVMSLVVERTLALVGADGAVIELLEGDEMVYRAVSGKAQPFLGLRLEVATSMSGLSIRTGETLHCRDSEQDPRVNLEACRRVGLRSMIIVPLRHHDTVVGALKVLSAEPDHFSESDVATLELLSDLVAAAMYFASRYDLNDLFHRATHDHLTGLANRALFMDRLRTNLACCTRDQQPLGVLIADLDDLKPINDRYGHRTGDALLREFARRSEGVARTTDTVARLGGDEFGMILVPIDTPAGLNSAMTRLTRALASPFRFEGQTLDLCASMGAALYPDDGDDLEALLEVADQRMYRQKRSAKRRRAAEH
ncbi:MAG: sensor domain-containing diguanylate cyclase [Marinobacter sp.]|uniref:sensor domain-containing diguanylate cyclase n=1 Tax=Marinobacter sp. TaxID=50741 RepID=UPI00299F1A73|nr:sensor domain-containing diguanylate cyclase [Marinobacter sp.]MDX1756030.1 sensor domain-containing diguanylate cyclase [Marinobacter sp.]